MDRITDQPAFILRRRDWRNTSLILDLFTRDFGCLAAVARGGRRNPARIGYQPFYLLHVSLGGRQELKTLGAAEAQALPVRDDNYLPLLYVNELIAALLPPQEPSPEVFDRYLRLLYRAEEKLDEAALRGFEFELVQQLGYFPDIAADARTGEPIEPDSWYQFVINEGFVACAENARDSVRGRVVIDWQQRDYRQAPVLRLAKSVLRSTIDFNLHGKALKSRDVYHEILRRR